jgi:predicted ABC-type exoprotein transport system permease subunit
MENIRKHWKWEAESMDRYCIFFFENYTGYFDLCLQLENIRIQIFYSSCTNSMDEFVEWIYKIENNEEIILHEIDEEGQYTKIVLEMINKLDKDLYELRIIHEGKPYNKYEFKKVISKDIFIRKLLYAIKNYFNEKEGLKNEFYKNKILKGLITLFEKYKTNEFEDFKNCKDKICKNEN